MVDTNDRTEVLIDHDLDPNVSVPGITVWLVPDQRDCIGDVVQSWKALAFGVSCCT